VSDQPLPIPRALAGAIAERRDRLGPLARQVLYYESIGSTNDAAASLATSSAVGITGQGAVEIEADNVVENEVEATAKQAEAGNFGMGATVALNIGLSHTDARIANGANVSGAGDLTVKASSTNDMTTVAEGGAAGKTAVTPVFATSVSSNDTQASLGSLVTATYPLDRYEDAITHAANAGPRGAVKIAFDLRTEKQRKDY